MDLIKEFDEKQKISFSLTKDKLNLGIKIGNNSDEIYLQEDDIDELLVFLKTVNKCIKKNMSND